MSSEIIILAGPNGAGKSTLAPFLLRDWLGLTEFVNADVIASGLSAFEPERAAFEAGRIMLRRLRELVAQRQNFAFETTLATRSYATWLRQLMQEGWHVNLVFIWLDSLELAVQRVAARVAAGGHDIPEATIRRRYDKGIRNFFTLYQELAESWAVYDNSDSSAPQPVAEGERRAVNVIHSPERWRTICDYL
jgi:predicted ABC-type ATPase